MVRSGKVAGSGSDGILKELVTLLKSILLTTQEKVTLYGASKGREQLSCLAAPPLMHTLSLGHSSTDQGSNLRRMCLQPTHVAPNASEPYRVDQHCGAKGNMVLCHLILPPPTPSAFAAVTDPTGAVRLKQEVAQQLSPQVSSRCAVVPVAFEPPKVTTWLGSIGVDVNSCPGCPWTMVKAVMYRCGPADAEFWDSLPSLCLLLFGWAQPSSYLQGPGFF